MKIATVGPALSQISNLGHGLRWASRPVVCAGCGKCFELAMGPQAGAECLLVPAFTRPWRIGPLVLRAGLWEGPG